MIVIHSIGFSSFGDSFLHEKMRWKTLDAREKFPRAQKQVLRGIVESMEILKTNSLQLVLSALHDILVFGIISRDFKLYLFNL